MFFNVVQKLCDEKGISISQLALNLKISKSNITNWKNGSTPRADKLEKISDYFGVTTDYLLGNEQKNKPAAESDELIDLKRILELPKSLMFNGTPLSDSDRKKIAKIIQTMQDK